MSTPSFPKQKSIVSFSFDLMCTVKKLTQRSHLACSVYFKSGSGEVKMGPKPSLYGAARSRQHIHPSSPAGLETYQEPQSRKNWVSCSPNTN